MARKPTQKRAKATVNTIIEGAVICLKNNGLEGTTTKKIAQISGVSIGSIYEYFDNKEDIYKAMVQVLVDEIVAMLQNATSEIATLDIGDAVRLLMSRYHDILQANNGQYLAVLTLLSRFEHETYIKQVENVLMDVIIKYTMQHPNYLNIPELITFFYVVINTGVFSTVRFLNASNSNISSQVSFDSLTEVIVSMIENHVSACIQKEV